MLLTISLKLSTLDVWQGSEYASENSQGVSYPYNHERGMFFHRFFCRSTIKQQSIKTPGLTVFCNEAGTSKRQVTQKVQKV